MLKPPRTEKYEGASSLNIARGVAPQKEAAGKQAWENKLRAVAVHIAGRTRLRGAVTRRVT